VTGELVVLSPVESAIDEGIGEALGEPELPEISKSLHPLEALENAALPALQRPPCFVMFSGGRDSSLLLSVATRVARREGLSLPIPVTHVFPAFPETDEADWQKLVLRHLRLENQLCQVFDGELNLLAPLVQESIRRHGLVAPAGVHLWVPAIVEARGGSLMTGQSGDYLLNGGSFARIRDVAKGHRRASLRTPLSIVRGLAPRPVRRSVSRLRLPESPSWLQPGAVAEWRSLQAAEEASEPLRWDSYVRWFRRRRYVLLCRQAVEKLANACEVRVFEPLTDELFLAALAEEGGALGWGTRTATLRALFGDLLPDAVLSRQSKADFTRAYWSGDAREFIRGWDGGGLPTHVDPEELRRVWEKDRPDARTGLLLQAAWATTLGPGEVKEPFNCRLE
jgi:asparagine synthase (glutamine-hydrolysing)